jgi:FlaA1/EpsC-like NDP-sugar epimerase
VGRGEALAGLVGERVLITGGDGSVGTALFTALLAERRIDVLTTDVATMDVTDYDLTRYVVRAFRPTIVFHLAGAKHAPAGEEDPWAAARINIEGTRNVIEASPLDARVVTASTCKACNPETAYGATKLIAERLTLNTSGAVARLYNVRETSGNVFETWAGLAPGEPVPVNQCVRYFMTLDECVFLLLWTAQLEPARYVFAAPSQWRIDRLAAELYPDRPQLDIGPRRGDRLVEPRWASSERGVPAAVDGIIRVLNAHDNESEDDHDPPDRGDRRPARASGLHA